MAVKQGMPKVMADYSDDNQKTFIDVASKYIDKQKKTFEERQGNSDVVNDIIETFNGDVEQKPIMKNPGDAPTEKQMEKFNQAVSKSTDAGDIELVNKAKKALADGQLTKGNVFDWIDSDGDWSLKDGS